MPRISQPTEITAQSVNTKKNFRERLMDRFSASDFVRVINPDDEKFFWSYMPSKNEELNMSGDGMHRFADRKDPEYYELGAGDTEVLVGECAYIMIEGLFKKIVAKKLYERQGEFKPGMSARSFNFSDALAQEQIIDQIYLGKEQPIFNYERVSDDTTGQTQSTARTKK